jgi:cell division protein FtsZ
MGAVIDEAMPGRVEVCVLGTSDMGGRSLPPRRPVVTPKSKVLPAPAPRTESPTAHVPSNAPEKTTSAELELATAATAKAVHAAKAAQEEFGFGEVESRGHFEKTDRNLFDGQDLDVPTYLRKGIKISI